MRKMIKDFVDVVDKVCTEYRTEISNKDKDVEEKEADDSSSNNDKSEDEENTVDDEKEEGE